VAKSTKAKKSSKPHRADRTTSRDAHAMLTRLREDSVAAFAATSTSTGPVAAADMAPVTFTCSNPGCIVGITVGTINIVFVGTGGAHLPVGASLMFWRVQGSGALAITATGGSLSSPISSTAPDAGMRTLTVPA
jgi:hypothetical protein